MDTVKAPESLALRANKRLVEEEVCPACQGKFDLGEEVFRCGACGGHFHQRCWEAQGGCSRPECREETQFCIFCGGEIKKSALKCRHCGKYLDASLETAGGGGDQTPVDEANTALILGIIGFFCCGVILGIIAIVKGNTALKIIEREPQRPGRGKAIAGIVLGIIDLVLHLLVTLIRLS